MDHLIVMDNVSRVADISKNFAIFLTVSRKFGYHCIYVFRVISPSTQIWQKIIQKQTFSIFFLVAYHIILYQKSYKVTA